MCRLFVLNSVPLCLSLLSSCLPVSRGRGCYSSGRPRSRSRPSRSPLSSPSASRPCVAALSSCLCLRFLVGSFPPLSLFSSPSPARGVKRPPPKVRREGRQQTSVQAGRQRQSRQRAGLPASRKASLVPFPRHFASSSKGRSVASPSKLRGTGKRTGAISFATPLAASVLLHFRIRGSIVVSISACHAEDPGSIPGRGVCLLRWSLWLAYFRGQALWLSLSRLVASASPLSASPLPLVRFCRSPSVLRWRRADGLQSCSIEASMSLTAIPCRMHRISSDLRC